MTDAIRDGNHVPVALGVSTSNAGVTTPFTIDPNTGQLQVSIAAGTGVAAPNSTPSRIGQFYVDTNAKKLYVATGTSSSADWTILN